MNNTSSTVISETGLTTEQITKASRHLSVTRGFLIESVSGLSAAQWEFKPADETWSIAENMEHIVLFESRMKLVGPAKPYRKSREEELREDHDGPDFDAAITGSRDA